MITICDFIGVEVTIELLLLLSYVLAQVQLLTFSLSLMSELNLLESDEMQSTLSDVLFFSKNFTKCPGTTALDNT